jgi:molybdenum cofactor cytidylyltransferase
LRLISPGGGPIVAPFYRGRPYHPIIFSKLLFPELMKARGDEGGRRILLAYKGLIKEVSFPPGLWFQDLDTPQDYQKLVKTIERNSR